MRTKIILFGILFSTLCSSSKIAAQQRILLHINKDGEQEAIPIRKGERAKDVLSRLEVQTQTAAANPNALRDSLTNFGKNGTTNFIQAHADVLFQWFDPVADGYVLEFGWRNGFEVAGVSVGKSNIRAWNADKRLLNLPYSALSKSGSDSSGNMGYYKKSDDGDGLKTPFKDEATDTNFIRGKGNVSIRFDPLGKEASWLKGGHKFELALNAWQSFRLADFGDTMAFKAHEPIGFTKENNSTLYDDGNMLVQANVADEWPYHSIKFYEGTPTNNYGWQIRDYEWNFYVIVEYTTDRPPKINKWDRLTTTLKTTPLTITANITDDNPAGGASGVKAVDLYVKVNGGAYSKSAMTGVGAIYTGTLSAASPGDTVAYYITATDVNNLSTSTLVTTYFIFKTSHRILYVWNGQSLPSGVTSTAAMAQYGMMKDSVKEAVWYDIWDVKSYGTEDIPALLPSYDGVVEATGDGGWADLLNYAATWLSTGTPQNPKVYFLSDQDHPWFFGSDTSFPDASPINKYFGILDFLNQDYPYTLNGNRTVTTPWQIAVDSSASSISILSSIGKYQKENGVTLWYHSNYEWPPFSNWIDELQPKAGAKIIFRDPKYNKVIGIRKSAPDSSWHTTFLAFDYLGCNFRSDTSTSIYSTPSKDPKYKKLINVANLAVNFIKTLTAVPVASTQEPGEFSLSQNYPNPFNPVTVISYQLAVNSFVTVKVYDLLGREVTALVNERKAAGNYAVQWDATHFASGVYFYRLQAGVFSDTKKLLLLK